jgi:ATP-dependent DNA ligase
MARSHLSIVLNERFEEDGEIVFREACRLGCEGIVSKRLGSLYKKAASATSVVSWRWLPASGTRPSW